MRNAQAPVPPQLSRGSQTGDPRGWPRQWVPLAVRMLVCRMADARLSPTTWAMEAGRGAAASHGGTLEAQKGVFQLLDPGSGKSEVYRGVLSWNAECVCI